MRRCWRNAPAAAVLLTVLVLTAAPLQAGDIEAVKGKRYRLTKRHGPWMIMVASLQDVPPERRTSGLSARQAADALVYALRSKGIPAYTFSQKDIFRHLQGKDGSGENRRASLMTRQNEISVIAGNYPSAKDEVAQKTLEYIKDFVPDFLRKEKNGAVYKKTPGRPGPLAGAFLTVNPLLSPEELKQRKSDPLLLKLNSGTDLSLLNNPGRFTLVVATFRGKTVTQFATEKFQQAKRKFDVTNQLDQAAMKAWQLARSLRQAKSFGYDRNYEAYVYHDRYRSLVTVGAFQSAQAPAVKELRKLFSAKVRKNPETGKKVLTAELFTIPRRVRNNKPPKKSWLFDPRPKLMKVPRFR